MPESAPFHLQVLQLGQIDLEDRLFALSPAWMDLEALVRSVERHGIVTPVQVQPIGRQRFRVVMGFRRVAAAVRLGLTRIPAIVRGEEEPLSLLAEALEENLSTREPGPIEKAHIVRVLQERFRLEDQVVMERFLPRLGIRADRFHLNRCLDLAGLPEPLQKGVVEGLEPEVALKLSLWTRQEQEFFEALRSRFRPGKNHQKQLFALLDELRASRRPAGPVSAMAIWEESGASKTAQEPARGRLEAFTACLDQLARLRYPRMALHRRRYEQLKSSLRLPPGLRLEVPPNFEGDHLRFSFSFASTEELSSVIDKLEEIRQGEEIPGILKLL